LIDLQNDSTVKDLLDDNTAEEFWIRMVGSNPNVAKVARCWFVFCFHIFMQVRISTMLFIKTTLRDRPELENDCKMWSFRNFSSYATQEQTVSNFPMTLVRWQLSYFCEKCINMFIHTSQILCCTVAGF